MNDSKWWNLCGSRCCATARGVLSTSTLTIALKTSFHRCVLALVREIECGACGTRVSAQIHARSLAFVHALRAIRMTLLTEKQREAYVELQERIVQLERPEIIKSIEELLSVS